MKIVLNLVMAAALLFGAAFIGAPAFAFFALRDAAASADAQAMGQLIDYPAVRQSLRPQLTGRPEIVTPPPSVFDDPIGAIRRRFEDAQAPAVGQPDTDAYLTPAALEGLMRGEGRYAADRSRPGALPRLTDEGERAPLPGPRYWGMNRARLAVTDDGGSETLFTFERRGLFDWKLAHIRLPEGSTPTVEARTPTR